MVRIEAQRRLESILLLLRREKFGARSEKLADICRRQEVELDRGTLGNWVGCACFHLQPIVSRVRETLRGADRIFADETRTPVLDPGRGRIRSGYFWSVVSDERGHGGAGPPVALFAYAPGADRPTP